MTTERQQRAIRIWLYTVAALVFAMVMIGGATRLTESGLSIVEWKPVTGALPPMSEAAWQAEFEKYKTIPQYQQVNRGMSLSAFKEIFWWEWAHRLMGRLIGVAFLLPFLFFLAKGWIGQGLRTRLWFIFALGALQGGIGWWMVASGLTERVNVSQYRLGVHLTLALAIFAALLWTALKLEGREPVEVPSRIRRGAIGLLVLVMVQMYLGALVAGLRAGLTYNTWPLIDGRLMPDAASLFAASPAWRNLFENTLTVQFNHRMVAYVVFICAVLHVIDVMSSARRVAPTAIALAAAVACQAIIGIMTLLHAVPISLGLAHQGGAVIVLALAVIHAHAMMVRRTLPAAGTFAPSR